MRGLLLLVFLAVMAYGQCAMCFRNAESQSKARAEALNKGIVILLVPLAGATGCIGYLAYRRRARTI
jgi:hypothetical protein